MATKLDRKVAFHFLKIYRNVLRKITIDLLHFWDAYDVNL